MPGRVRITDVSPRDGLQNEAGFVPTHEKGELVELLAATGVDEVEVTSFVSAEWVPQLGDASSLLEMLAAVLGGPGPVLSALVPNERGMLGVVEANRTAGRVLPEWGSRALVSKVAVFAAASETFSKRNINATIAESIKRFEPVVAMARGAGLAVRGYVSCAIECPFEGPIAPGKVSQVAQALSDLGVDEIDLGDTIGAGEAESINALLQAMVGRLGDAVLGRLTLHLHDTFGRAAECVREALQLGVRSFDGAVGGLGGCPYASTAGKRAPGNISTELLVRTVHDAGYETAVDLDRVAEAAKFAREIVASARAGSSKAGGMS